MICLSRASTKYKKFFLLIKYLEYVARLSNCIVEAMHNWSRKVRTKAFNRYSRPISLAAFSFLALLIYAMGTRFRGTGRVLSSIQHDSISRYSPSSSSVWLLVFDNRWRVLVPSPRIVLPKSTSQAEAASSLAESLLKGCSNRLYQIGKKIGSEQVFAVALETSVQKLEKMEEGSKFIKPVRLAKMTSKDSNLSKEGLIWMNRAVSLSIRLFYEASIVPRLNPMEEAKLDVPLCCDRSVKHDGDLRLCGKDCTSPGVFNILSVFPS